MRIKEEIIEKIKNSKINNAETNIGRNTEGNTEGNRGRNTKNNTERESDKDKNTENKVNETREKLLSFIRNSLEKGYDIENIRRTLLDKGYGIKYINLLIDETYDIDESSNLYKPYDYKPDHIDETSGVYDLSIKRHVKEKMNENNKEQAEDKNKNSRKITRTNRYRSFDNLFFMEVLRIPLVSLKKYAAFFVPSGIASIIIATMIKDITIQSLLRYFGVIIMSAPLTCYMIKEKSLENIGINKDILFDRTLRISFILVLIGLFFPEEFFLYSLIITSAIIFYSLKKRKQAGYAKTLQSFFLIMLSATIAYCAVLIISATISWALISFLLL